MSEHVRADHVVLQPLKALPVHTIVQLLSGEIVFICHRSETEICVANTNGDHWNELPRAMAIVRKLPSDLCAEYIRSMSA
jgi:hypothetical protein